MKKRLAGMALSIFLVGPAVADEPEPFAVQYEYRLAGGEWSAPETVRCDALARCDRDIELSYKGRPMPVRVSVLDAGKPDMVRVYTNPGGEFAQEVWLMPRWGQLARIDGRSRTHAYTWKESKSIKEYRETGVAFVEHDVVDFRFTYVD